MPDKVVIAKLSAWQRLVLVPLLAGCAAQGPAMPAGGATFVIPETLPKTPATPGAPATTGTPATRPAPAEARIVVADIPVESFGRLRFDVSAGRCAEPASCPLEVRLLKDGRVLDAVELAQVDTSLGVAPDVVEPSWGAGDPLQGEPARPAQRLGDPERGISVLARAVTLTRTERALLVTQQFGFEHVHRQNDLFVASGERLTRAWSGKEGAGPAWTSVAIVPRPDGTEALVYFERFFHPDLDEPDTLGARALTWDVQRRAVVEPAQVSAAAPVYAAVVGRFAKPRAAHKAREGSSRCLAQSFSVLPLEQIPGAGRGAYALTAMSTRRDLAEKALADGKGCLSTPVGSLLQLP